MDRFKEAQDQPHAGFQEALREIQAGGKRGHWIWYVFPQLAGLGMSGMSMRYGIADIDEAVEYLQDETLRDRLLTITRAVATALSAPRSGSGSSSSSGSGLGSIRLAALMGSHIDAQKLVSSMTLFARVSEQLRASGRDNDKVLADFAELATLAREVLAAAAAEGYPPCQFTLARLQD